MASLTHLVTCWLSSPSSQLTETPTVEALFRVIENTQYHEEFLEQVCNLLFTFYRSSDESKKKFAIAFVPSLIELHLRTIKTGRDPLYRCIDVVLLGLYNLEVADEEGNPIQRKFRMPLLSKPSVFHETSPSNMQPQTALTEHALHKLDSGMPDLVISSFGPYMEYDQMNASSRMNVLMVLMKVYNEYLSSLPKESLRSVCRACVKIIPGASTSNVTDGHSPNDRLDFTSLISKAIPQISLSEDFLVELCYAVYFCLYNDIVIEGRKALEKIHSYALCHLYPSVLLMTNAIRNSLRVNLSYQESQESPLDISMSTLSPTSSVTSFVTQGVSKIAITNASFKTRKLPDDIPIVSPSNLGSIDEGEESSEVKNPASKGTSKQTPPGKIIKNLLHKKDKKPKESRLKLRSESEETSKVTIKEELPDNDIGSMSSGVSDSKSCGSDHEMIPLSQMNRSHGHNKAVHKQGQPEDESGELSDGDTATAALITGASDAKQ